MLTLLETVKKTTDFLSRKGVESARLNAEMLIGHALGLPRMQLYLQFERPLTEIELGKIRPLVRRRGTREPLQYILGEMDFFNVRLKVDRRALIPRPETEQLVEIITLRRPDSLREILDLGTGSGAIALALANHFPAARVTATDVSVEALALAQENAVSLNLEGRVRMLQSDWLAAVPVGETFDLIVTNPPYLSDDEVRTAQPEVRDYEPCMALSAGADSAAALGFILRESRARLKAGGLLAMETGSDQHHDQLLGIAVEYGYVRTESLRDLNDRERFFLAFA